MRLFGQLVLGTRNRKKAEELVDLLKPLGLTIQTLADFSAALDIEETGTSFAENAALKATGQAAHLGVWVLGEDSGLVVPGLGGRPGVYSARYAGKQGDDEANNQKLIAEIKILPVEKRTAYYVCTAALSDPTGNVHSVVEGRCNGVLIPERRGDGGFGYDPYFLIPEFHATFGELSSRVKHALSHRAR